MFSVVQPMQSVTVDGQEAIFIPNMGGQQIGGQGIQIGNQPTFITPNGQIIRAPNGVMPANILQNIGQTVQLPTGWYTKNFFLFFFCGRSNINLVWIWYWLFCFQVTYCVTRLTSFSYPLLFVHKIFERKKKFTTQCTII